MNASGLPDDGADPVLVVGGGPVGLTAALLLARQGVPVVVLERRRERSAAPRAHVLNPRTLEIYRAFDFDVEAMTAAAASPADDAYSHFDWRTTGRRFGCIPFEGQDDTHTPLPRINLQQPRLESLLLREAAQSPLVDLRVGHRVTDLITRDDDALATIASDDGQTYTLAGQYALACDGANSEVRSRLGIGLHGQPDVQPCLTIHFEGSLRELVRDRPGMFFWSVGAKLPGIFIAYDIDHTWVYLSLMAPEIIPTEDEALAIVYDALGADVEGLTVRHVIPWVMTAQVADHFRAGRVFLVGDAAHRFPPSGGLGLNTGIQDAHNLAWKLAAVRAGHAGPGLLDSYEHERQSVAEANTAQSLANAVSALRVFDLTEDAPQRDWDAAIAGMYDGLNSLALQIGFTYADIPAPHTSVQEYVPRAEPGDRLPHAWCTVDGRRLSALDLLDPRRFTILTGRIDDWVDVNVAAPVTVRSVADSGAPHWWMRLTGLTDGGALLVRPDGHILARTDSSGPSARADMTRRLATLLDA